MADLDVRQINPVTGAPPTTRIADAASLNSVVKKIVERDLGSAPSQLQAAAMNDKIRARNLVGIVGFAAGGVAMGAGLTVLLWPDRPTSLAVTSALGAATLTVRTSAW